MLALTFLITTVIAIYTKVLLLRIWMQWARCDFYNPFSQFVVKITQPVIRPLRRIIPSIGPIDTASLLVAYVLSVIFLPVALRQFTLDPLFLYLGLVLLIKAAGVLVFWVIIIRSLMSWISQGRNPVDFVLMQLSEPLMAPFRRIIPPMGGIDFSAMAVILILYALNLLGLEYIPYWMQL